LNFLNAETRCAFILDNEALDLVVGDITCPNNRYVTPWGIADPLLLTVDDPGIPLTFRGRGESSARARPYQRLSQTEAADFLHPRHRR
jgi:hypothetical protein